MNQEMINEILQKMENCLNDSQLLRLRVVLNGTLSYEGANNDSSKKILECFIETKRLEGRSEKTLNYYKNTVEKMLNVINKKVTLITTEDLRTYLTNYENDSKIGKTGIDNIRRNLSSFFGWMEDENYILKSPVRRIHKIKGPIIIREAFNEYEIEKIRNICNDLREKAIVETFISTGIRVGELVNLNKDDVNFYERECLVKGKGNKERVVYFSAKAKMCLEEYVASRKDHNNALFVENRYPHDRMSISGIERIIRTLGKKAGISKCHPHRFRRTLATTAIDKGMPIEQVQQLLGHEKIDTTLNYAMVKQSNVKNAHRKYIG